MSGFINRKTGPQGKRSIVRSDSGFLGGMNIDVPNSEIDDSEVAYCENYIAYRTHLATRSGTKEYATLPGTGTVHSIFYHPGKKAIVLHRGTVVHISIDNGSTWNTATGSISTITDADSRIKAHKQNVVIYQADQLTIVELDNSNYMRVLNADNPTDRIQISTGGNNGEEYVYRFIYTYARYVGDVLVAESGTVQNISTNQPNYTEVGFSTPIDVDNPPKVINFTAPTGTGWTHIRVYRTLELNANNSETRYYRIADYSFAVAEASPSFGIGSMVIGSTFIIAAEEDSIGVSDEFLIQSRDRLSKTYGFVPVPNGLVGEIGPAFLFVGPLDGTKLYYSEYGSAPEKLGYYNEGFQFEDTDDSLQAMIKSPDSMIILCSNSTYRMVPETYQDVGVESGNGQFIPSVFPATLVDSNVGVLDFGSISLMDRGAFIAHCSDGTIRKWDGVQWSNDLARFKVSKEVKKMTNNSVGLYSEDGFYLIWYSVDEEDTVTNKCLRLGMAEDVGLGWTFYSGTGWSFPPLGKGSIRTINTIDNLTRMLVLDNTDNKLYWIETYDGPSNSGLSMVHVDKSGTSDVDISTKVRFKEILGSRNSFFIRHQETDVSVRPFERYGAYLSDLEMDLNGYSDDNLPRSATYVDFDLDGNVHFDKDVVGKRISIEIEANKGSHIITDYQTIAMVEERPTFGTDRSQEVKQGNLAQGMVIWISRPDLTKNLTNNNAGTSTGTVTTTTGPDSKSDTAFVFNGA